MLTPSPLRQRPLFLNDAADNHHRRRQRRAAADEQDSSISPPFFTTNTSNPLRTPVKQIHRLPTHLTPSATLGTKRKSTPHTSTPIRQHNLTPLVISSRNNNPDSDLVMFDRLAPLPAPTFVASTPQTKAETDAHLRRQTATLTRLKLSDFVGESLDPIQPREHNPLFTQSLHRKYPRKELEEEVAEAISPGGHVIKRRARRRPLSAELLESARSCPSAHVVPTSNLNRAPRNTGIVFPSAQHPRKRTTSGSSSSDPGSPVPRRRLSNARLCPQKLTSTLPTTSRHMSRQDSATLFFGPAIPQASNSAPVTRSRINSSLSSSTSAVPPKATRATKAANRHSYAGPGATHSNFNVWNTIQTRDRSPSPKSSPPAGPVGRYRNQDDDDENIFFGSGSQGPSSFIFNVTEGTPSPTSKRPSTTTLPRKFKPLRDSGIALSDDDDDMSGDHLSVMPGASTSVGSIQSDAEDNLVTPGFGPETGSGWPSVFVTGTDDAGSGEKLDVDAFIMRTLAATSKSREAKKRVPGTPVKKVKTTFLPGGARPWQSAVAAKVGPRFDFEEAKKGNAPRQSLPAAFPPMGKLGKKPTTKLALDQDTESDTDDDSPGKRGNYANLGIGRPSASTPHDGNPFNFRARWLMRRSSSGAFSSGSESISSSGTPTRADRKASRPYLQLSPSQQNSFKLGPIRTASSSSSSSAATLNSPSIATSRRLQTNQPRPTPASRRMSEPFTETPSGRFTRDFIADDEIGSGEFGKVIKVRCKNVVDSEVYAVKKSKRLEGPRHRLRLREEVQVLQHLSQVAANSASYERNRHPNVLAYIDSWEEDETLFIQTELCGSGNLAEFLWEFGRMYPRLAEERVWKIVVDLSNGLRFIHNAGVIHLDLKPSNVFVTDEGRFKIGDFGMATLWPRPSEAETGSGYAGFEREGDKLYLAPEVLQGHYSKAADVFSFGMTILETATNIVVPDQGEGWQRLRREDFSQVDLDETSAELVELILQMMRTEPSARLSVDDIWGHGVVCRAREVMERMYFAAKRDGTSLFAASPLGSVEAGFLDEILGRGMDMGV